MVFRSTTYIGLRAQTHKGWHTTGRPQKHGPPTEYLSPTTDQEAAFLILNHLANRHKTLKRGAIIVY